MPNFEPLKAGTHYTFTLVGLRNGSVVSPSISGHITDDSDGDVLDISIDAELGVSLELSLKIEPDGKIVLYRHLLDHEASGLIPCEAILIYPKPEIESALKEYCEKVRAGEKSVTATSP